MQSRLKFLLSFFSHSLGLSMGVCVRASPHWDVKMSVHCQAVSPSKQGPCGIRVQPIHLRTINSFLRALNRSSIKEAPVDLLLMITAWAIWPISGKTGQIRPKIMQCVYHPFAGFFYLFFTNVFQFFGCPGQLNRWPCHCHRHMWLFWQLIRKTRRQRQIKRRRRRRRRWERFSDLVT